MWVSLAAISVAVWTGRQSQQHAGLSVIPAFSVWGEYPTGANRRCKILVANKGFGPAIIDRVELFFNKDRIDGYMYEKVQAGIKQAFGGHVVDIERSATEEKGHAFGADREIELARFVVTEELVKQGAQGIGERLRPMTLTIQYSDIYGRKWYFLVREFEGVTWRRNSPAHLWRRLWYWRYLPAPWPISCLTAPWRLVGRYRAEQ
ncbi:hypothetical protein [Marinobacter alkaliphilus]|uniref:Uncharacterized protein n=1 Tax=Marinobacter alkaliphilus TaxID=254719 RepID=A0ABZ3E5W4_9GAMM